LAAHFFANMGELGDFWGNVGGKGAWLEGAGGNQHKGEKFGKLFLHILGKLDSEPLANNRYDKGFALWRTTAPQASTWTSFSEFALSGPPLSGTFENLGKNRFFPGWAYFVTISRKFLGAGVGWSESRELLFAFDVPSGDYTWCIHVFGCFFEFGGGGVCFGPKWGFPRVFRLPNCVSLQPAGQSGRKFQISKFGSHTKLQHHFNLCGTHPFDENIFFGPKCPKIPQGVHQQKIHKTSEKNNFSKSAEKIMIDIGDRTGNTLGRFLEPLLWIED